MPLIKICVGRTLICMGRTLVAGCLPMGTCHSNQAYAHGNVSLKRWPCPHAKHPRQVPEAESEPFESLSPLQRPRDYLGRFTVLLIVL